MEVDGRKNDPELIVGKRSASGNQVRTKRSASGNQIQTSGEAGIIGVVEDWSNGVPHKGPCLYLLK